MRCAGWLSPDQVKDIAATEDDVSVAQRAFYHAALPAVPALLLGFASLEGQHLVSSITPFFPKDGDFSYLHMLHNMHSSCKVLARHWLAGGP